MGAKEWEETCTRVSTLDEVHSTEVVAKHKSEMNEQLVGHNMEMDPTNEGVWKRKDEEGDPKKAWKWLDRGHNRFQMSLVFPASKVWVHVASFVSYNRVVQWLLFPSDM